MVKILPVFLFLYALLPLHAQPLQFHKSLVGNLVTDTPSFFSSKSDSIRKLAKGDEAITAAVMGGIAFGLFGALIGARSKTNCSGSSDVLVICYGDGHRAKVGASIGGNIGAMMGFLSERKQIKKNHKFLRIMAGTTTGSIAGYYLAEKTFGISTLVFPALFGLFAIML